MQALIDDRTLIEKMRKSIRPIKSVEEDAHEVIGYYEQVISQRTRVQE
jgi:hypothetical protein